MAPDFSQSFAGMDAFGAFWTDFVKRMATIGVTPPAAAPTPDVLSQIRRVFFDAMAQHAEQFMRSEAFLNAMKQSMEHSLAIQQSMNEFIKKGLAAGQMPTRDDADHITLLVRGVEERVLDRLEKLGNRLDRLENGRGPAAKAAPVVKAAPAGRAAARSRTRVKK